MNEVMDPIEVAEYLRVCKQTVYKMVRENEIPYFKVRRKIFFRKDYIDDWVAHQNENAMQHCMSRLP